VLGTNEEESGNKADQKQVLKEPESILNARSNVFARTNAKHQHHENEEERGHSTTESEFQSK
jgi:hypothetical protein